MSVFKLRQLACTGQDAFIASQTISSGAVSASTGFDSGSAAAGQYWSCGKGPEPVSQRERSVSMLYKHCPHQTEMGFAAQGLALRC